MPNKNNLCRLLIGVTGGIGSGKSLVCSYFEEFGGKVLVADKIARDLYVSNYGLINMLKDQFGRIIIDEKGNLSSEKFRKIVFSSDANHKRVNRIVHPFVIDEILKITKSTSPQFVFVEAALIFESGFDKYLDYTIEVFANMRKRMDWVRKRSRLSNEIIRSIIKLQMPEREKMKRADFIIKNNSSKGQLRKNSKFVFKLLTNLV